MTPDTVKKAASLLSKLEDAKNDAANVACADRIDVLVTAGPDIYLDKNSRNDVDKQLFGTVWDAITFCISKRISALETELKELGIELDTK